MDLGGKTVLITGAARRIGREIALALASHGAGIVLHYRESAAEARSLREEIRNLGSEAFLARADFSSKAGLLPRIRSFLKKIYREIPRIDILVNNASVFYPTPVERIREKDWDDFMDVNLKAPFFLAREIGLRMVKRKSGKIVNLIDWTAASPRRNYLPYCISKAGLIAATQGLAKAFAPHVQVNGIAPGPILPARGMTRAGKEAVISKTLLKRFGSPKDIAAAVLFLVSGTDYVTGAVIPVDGGSLIA